MWLIAMKGLPGCGKSAVSRALGKQLGSPVIDKDDIKDILDGHTPEAGPLAYQTMFNVARRQLLQGLDVICDSPLTFRTRVLSLTQSGHWIRSLLKLYSG